MKHQVAAIPILVDDDGVRRVVLMTSRETRRWVIPKGSPIKGLKPHKAAAREAFEEAGLIGDVSKKSIGSYEYQKRLGDVVEPCDVAVYLMAVRSQAPIWPEQGERDIEPVTFEEAALRVDEQGLKAIFERLAEAV
jgi:8-oxo-dGTP pyrophosphatase MutT (NUDIX family)